MNERHPEPSYTRPLGLTLTAFFFLIEGIALEAISVFSVLLGTQPPGLRELGGAAAFGLFLALPFVAVSVGLLYLKKWAYWSALLLCALIILSIPGWQLMALMFILPPQLLVGSYLLMNDELKRSLQ